MNWKAYIALGVVATAFAAGGWALGRSLEPAPPEPPEARVHPGYVIDAMERELLMSLDATQRQIFLDTVERPDRLKAVTAFFKANPITPRNDVFEMIDVDDDGVIDHDEFDQAQQFVWVVKLEHAPRPRATEPAADIDLLLYLDDIQRIDARLHPTPEVQP